MTRRALIAAALAAAVALGATALYRPVATVPQIESFDPDALTPQQRIDQAWEAMRLHNRGYR